MLGGSCALDCATSAPLAPTAPQDTPAAAAFWGTARGQKGYSLHVSAPPSSSRPWGLSGSPLQPLLRCNAGRRRSPAGHWRVQQLGGGAPGRSTAVRAEGGSPGSKAGGAKGGLAAPASKAAPAARQADQPAGTPPPPAIVPFYVRSSKDADVDFLGESTKFDMSVRSDVWLQERGWGRMGAMRSTVTDLDEEEEARQLAHAKDLLDRINVPAGFPAGEAARGVFCSRTLNLRSISTIGYDMDYTLIHYNVAAWEGRAYDYGMDNLAHKGFPVDGLKFDPDLVIRGLIMDKELGNLVKADRFGYVKRAMHGTDMLSNREISSIYGRELIDLRNQDRWEFLNTLFSVSEAVMYMQLVDRLDEGYIPQDLGPLNYESLHKAVAKALFRAHVEGQLKAEIINNPGNFVELDPELPLTLLDQKEAGKRLLLITNSDYHYTHRMMSFCFDRFLPQGQTWRDLFDMVIVSARKPEFFQMNHPLYEVVTEDGLMRPCFNAHSGGLYAGGSAAMVEAALGFSGDETLYVGDHIYTDVSVSKVHLRWRTALICRELELEVEALQKGAENRARLLELFRVKEVLGDTFNQLRLALQRQTRGRPAQTLEAEALSEDELTENLARLLLVMEQADQQIAPLLERDGDHFNSRWGYLSRAGLNDKSHLTRQIEKYADIYTSKVSNFLRYTPFMYFRSPSQSLAHELDVWSEEQTSQ